MVYAYGPKGAARFVGRSIKMYYLLMCRSLTYAQRTAKLLESVGIVSFVMRTPQSVTTEGCGYCVKIKENVYKHALQILKKNDLMPKRIFRQEIDGRFAEVFI